MAAPGRASSSGSATPRRASGSGEGLPAYAGSPAGQQSPRGRGTPAQPRTLSDKYQLGEELGRGAYGLVFKGVDTRTGEAVAIKQLSLAGISPESLHSIMGEIELLKNLHHRNIVKYVGSFKTRTHLYIILEFMEAGALSAIIKPTKFGAFPESLVAVYIAQVLQGLAYLHDQGVVHRDIKGANILTTKEGLVKLADFGVAARLSELEADRDRSAQSVVGTPYWMAPEVIEMTSITPASDIWSVGCLAIELLTGQPPYFELQPMSALFRIVQDDAPELPGDVSADMTDFLQQCFQKDPQRRPAAAALLRHRWLAYHRRTLRSSWSRTQGAKSRGQRTDAHVAVSTVVERILQAEADEFAAAAAAAQAQGTPMPAAPEARPPPQRPSMNESRVAAGGSRGGSLQRDAQPPADVAEAPPAEGPGPAHPLAPASEQGGAASLAGSRAGSLRAAGGGGGQRSLLESLLRAPGPPTQEAGDDMLVWLQRKERSHAAEPVLPEGGKLAPEEVVDGAISRHQEVAELRKLIAELRLGYGRRRGGGGGGERAAKAAEAGGALLRLCREDPDRIEVFLAEDGGVVLLELLRDPCAEQVALHALQLAHELVALDARALGRLALLGAVPAVAEYAGGGGPPELARSRELRLAAARVLQQAARMGLVAAQLLVACQCVPVLVGLVEPSFKEHGPLTHIGVDCCWRLLELHGGQSVGQVCRLLAAAGLAANLVTALQAAAAQARVLDAQRPTGSRMLRTSSRPDAASLAAGLQPPQPDRAGSLGQASPRHQGWGSGSYAEADASEGLHALLEKMGNLLLVLAHGDTAVKATLCEAPTLRTLFAAVEFAGEPLQLTALKAVKHLTCDPTMLDALQEAGTIEALGKYLQAPLAPQLQLEALHALHNLCKISRLRQEGAAKAGLVPYLMALAQAPAKRAPDPPREQLRQMAVSLLCGMAHSTHLTRSFLWANNGLAVLLDLLEEEDWQGPALDALAVWLSEDAARIEPRLTQRLPVGRFVRLFGRYAGRGGSDELARLLEPFLRILRRSPQITVEVAVAGLAGLVVEMLRSASALTALSLLQMVRLIYEHHPRPKEFVAKYAIAEQLRQLARQQASVVLVKKQAVHLLHAFQINSVF